METPPAVWPTRLENMIHDLIGASPTRRFDARQIAAALEAGELPVQRIADLEAACRHALDLLTCLIALQPAEFLTRLNQMTNELTLAVNKTRS